MKQKRNISFTLILILIFIACLMACLIVLVLLFSKDTKQSTFRYVEQNQPILSDYVTDLMQNQTSDYFTTYNGWDTFYWQSSGMVEFIVNKRGIVSSSQYYGFYYSPDNIPLCFQSYNGVLCTSNLGWTWHEVDGDNWGYTERIIENWFWFEFHS